MKYCATCKIVYPADFQCCPKDGSALSSRSEYLPGMVIREKYEILQRIGSGGMATVYQVRHLVFNEIRAIKLINSQLADGDQFIKRLRSEAVTARRLQHPNAVHVDDLDRTEDGRPFIVMEYVEGRNLRTVIREEGPLPTLRALYIGAQVASALAAAHNLGITHRDVKPDNIQLISLPDGTDFVKVLDFGIAKFRQAASSSAPLTASGLLVGTPQYVSPEQAMGRHGIELDGRSDLYALGIVLYEMLTGRVPFDSDTPVGLLVHHLHTAPIPPHKLRPDLKISPSVSSVLMKALEKNPDDRFQNADEMRDAILALAEEIKQPSQVATPSLTVNREIAAEIDEVPEQQLADPDEPLDTATSQHRTPALDLPAASNSSLQASALNRSVLTVSQNLPAQPSSALVQLPAASAQPSPASGQPSSIEQDLQLHDTREELLRAADEGQPPSRRLYWAIAAFASLFLIILVVHRSRSAPEKPPAPTQNLEVQSPPQSASPEPAAPLVNSTTPPTTQPSSLTPQNPNPPTQNPSPMTGQTDPLNPEQRAKVKDFISQGRALSDQGEYQAAIEMFDSALKIDPQNGEAKVARRLAKQRMELEQTLPNEPK